ncbi:hypothetical protein [uncultured Clostridium sp.]|jgi:hypothetical protein|uniref:hypothetical protein n=1 Tax=Clostridium disporicum TaxID=84024 RepID=UPI0025DEEB67|nr:hypothetical protein [uncultured Clostridium sp.]MDU2290703.1 hypothetical protein [Clostridium celatum]MDU4325418.1 hypothetical protein [Clostridium celatum]
MKFNEDKDVKILESVFLKKTEKSEAESKRLLEELEELEEFEGNELEKEGETSEFEYGKYMVISDKDMETEEVYGVFDYEIDALRRYSEVKFKRKKRNVCVIKADIEYIYLQGVKFIFTYEEV